MKAFLTKWVVALAALAGGVAVVWWVVGAFGLVAFIGECRGHGREQEAITAPVVAPPTKAEEKAPPIVVTDVDVKAIDPPKRERKRIAEEYNRPDLASDRDDELERLVVDGGATRVAEIVGERELPPMKDGGKALITLEPDGRIEITTVANPDRFFEWESDFEFGGVYGRGFNGEVRWRGWGAIEPVSIGRVHLRLEVGAEGRAGQTDPYIMAGGVFRGRYRD